MKKNIVKPSSALSRLFRTNASFTSRVIYRCFFVDLLYKFRIELLRMMNRFDICFGNFLATRIFIYRTREMMWGKKLSQILGNLYTYIFNLLINSYFILLTV